MQTSYFRQPGHVHGISKYKILLKLINEFKNVIGYRGKFQKSTVFLYTSKKQKLKLKKQYYLKKNLKYY